MSSISFKGEICVDGNTTMETNEDEMVSSGSVGGHNDDEAIENKLLESSEETGKVANGDVDGSLDLPTQAPVEGVYRPIILDIQLLETKRGYLIKELAYKSFPCQTPENAIIWPVPDRSLHYACYRHDPRDIPSHRTIRVNGRVHDRFTGLEICGGDVAYSDEEVVHELACYNLIFLKGHNKKRMLCELFKRTANVAAFELPKIVNVDSSTMEEEDRSFCQKHLVSGADFSFKFVYKHFSAYLKMVFEQNEYTWTDAPVYLSNIIVKDEGLRVFARGRPLWVCPRDHACGQQHFSTQRCAVLNVGLLETLWYMMRDEHYRKLLKEESQRSLNNVKGADGFRHTKVGRCHCVACPNGAFNRQGINHKDHQRRRNKITQCHATSGRVSGVSGV